MIEQCTVTHKRTLAYKRRAQAHRVAIPPKYCVSAGSGRAGPAQNEHDAHTNIVNGTKSMLTDGKTQQCVTPGKTQKSKTKNKSRQNKNRKNETTET